MHRTAAALAASLAVACGERLPVVEVVSAVETGFLQESAAIQGRDGGESARVWGRAIFAFGDTVLNRPDAEGQTWHHNSFAFTEDADASDGIGPLLDPLAEDGSVRYLVPPTVAEAAFNAAHRGDPCAQTPCGARWAAWPGAPVWDAARARALILYGLVYAEPGEMNFRGVGGSIAVWHALEAAPERPEVAPGTEHPTLLWREGELAPGLAPQVVGDELRAFGCREAFLSRPCVLFSAPLARALEREAWRAWDGTGWTADAADAAELFDGAPILSVQWSDFAGAFVALYSKSLSDDVVLRTAPALTGPWSEEIVVLEADHGAADGPAYDALAHAEFAQDGGRILYVTYSRPTGETWFSARFPLVRVELRRR